jgi:hypothetical protein
MPTGPENSAIFYKYLLEQYLGRWISEERGRTDNLSRRFAMGFCSCWETNGIELISLTWPTTFTLAKPKSET